MFALPVCLGGLGLADPSAIAGFEFESVTTALTNQILHLQNDFDANRF